MGGKYTNRQDLPYIVLFECQISIIKKTYFFPYRLFYPGSGSELIVKNYYSLAPGTVIDESVKLVKSIFYQM